MIQFSPKNVFFDLMSELIHHLLLSLPPKIANQVLLEHRDVLYQSETMLESATKLLSAEDYFQSGTLRTNYERFRASITSAEGRMDLLPLIAAQQFWRVFRTDEKEAAFSLIAELAATVLPPETPPAPRHLLFLLAAHRIIQSLCRSAASEAESSQPSATAACRALLPDMEAAAFRNIYSVLPSAFEAPSQPSLRVLCRAFFRYIMFNKSSAATIPWPPAWQEFLAELGETHVTPATPTPATPTASSDAAASHESPAPTDTPLLKAIQDQDLFAINRILKDAAFPAGSADHVFVLALQVWFMDFLDLYRSRFDFICPFGMGIESFECDEDNATKLPRDQPRAYTLSTGTVLSEFGRRGMGLERLDHYDRQPAGQYTARDPTTRGRVEFYFRDRKAERAILNIFKSLRRLAKQINKMDTPELNPELRLILGVLRRYIEQFDSAFLEKKIHADH
jgi:hypothetical protein